MPTITVQMPLSSLSKRKRERLQSVMERQQEIAQVTAGLMPSIPVYRWGNTRNDPVFFRWVQNEFPDRNGLRAHDAYETAYKVSENFRSWLSRGGAGERPQYEEATWARFCNCNDPIRYEKNDGVWGVKLPLEPRDGEWFRLQTGDYQEEYLEKYAGEEASFGSAEVKRQNGGFILNQTVVLDTTTPEYEPETVLGVDMGLNNIATVVVVQDGEVVETAFFSGDRVGHYRRRMRELRSQLQAAGHTDKVEEMRDLERRFAEQENHTISRRIVDLAAEYERSVIAVEELTGIRKHVNETMRGEVKTALNNWTFADLQSMIAYKAEMEEIPFTTVRARGTSSSCNRCGEEGRRPHNGDFERFYCPACDYEVDADFNGAVNIAKRAEG